MNLNLTRHFLQRFISSNLDNFMHNKDNNYNIYVLFSNFQSKGPNSPQKVAKLKNYKVIANLHFFFEFFQIFYSHTEDGYYLLHGPKTEYRKW